MAIHWCEACLRADGWGGCRCPACGEPVHACEACELMTWADPPGAHFCGSELGPEPCSA